jgi:hypothetical protein
MDENETYNIERSYTKFLSGQPFVPCVGNLPSGVAATEGSSKLDKFLPVFSSVGAGIHNPCLVTRVAGSQ